MTLKTKWNFSSKNKFSYLWNIRHQIFGTSLKRYFGDTEFSPSAYIEVESGAVASLKCVEYTGYYSWN